MSMTADEWGIPTLSLDWAATRTDLAPPALRGWHGWGDNTRNERANGRGVHFYKDDYKFVGLHRNPDRLLRFGCPVTVEPNYSTWPGMPRCIALADIYRKRTLAWGWGRAGIKILVDLNIIGEFRDIALLGVPKGWPSYAVRWHGADGERIKVEERLAWARRHGGRQATMIVFSGGREGRRLASALSLPWVATYRHGNPRQDDQRRSTLEGPTSVRL